MIKSQESTLRKFRNSLEFRRFIKEKYGAKILLAFSGGKDAIAAWLALRDGGVEVFPYHMTLVPGMSFVEESLSRYEAFFGAKIVRVTHPSFFRWLCNLVFQPPERCAVIESYRLPSLTYEDQIAVVRQRLGEKASGVLVASGVRAADSPYRRHACDKYGALRELRLQVWPIYDWGISEVEKAIVGSGCRLSIEYERFGRAFDGIDYRFLEPIKRVFPEDYKRILDWFPLADLELFRRGERSAHA